MVNLARRFDGSTWHDAGMRRWDGSTWVDFHSPGSLAPTVVGAASGGYSGSGNGEFTVPLPPGATSYIAATTTSEPEDLLPPNGWNHIADLGGSDYQLYHAPSTPGEVWEGNWVAAVIVIGYDTPINVSTPVVSRSLISPSVQSPGPALVLHGVSDMNDDPSAPIVYPPGDPEGRVQRVQPEPSSGWWAASVAAASHNRVGAGATGTAEWGVPDAWQPAAWTVLITIAS